MILELSKPEADFQNNIVQEQEEVEEDSFNPEILNMQEEIEEEEMISFSLEDIKNRALERKKIGN